MKESLEQALVLMEEELEIGRKAATSLAISETLRRTTKAIRVGEQELLREPLTGAYEVHLAIRIAGTPVAIETTVAYSTELMVSLNLLADAFVADAKTRLNACKVLKRGDAAHANMEDALGRESTTAEAYGRATNRTKNERVNVRRRRKSIWSRIRDRFNRTTRGKKQGREVARAVTRSK